MFKTSFRHTFHTWFDLTSVSQGEYFRRSQMKFAKPLLGQIMERSCKSLVEMTKSGREI